MKFDVLSGTVATNEEVPVPGILNAGQFIEAVDEIVLYQQLSKQLSLLEVMLNYKTSQVKTIQVQVDKMMIYIDEKEELLMRCEWLITMKNIEEHLDQLTTLDSVKATCVKLGRVQTCPLKNELKAKLDALEAQFETTKELSAKEQLVEDIFATGNETFINLGTNGREHVLAEVFKETPSVDLAISKAENLEAQVQGVKLSTTVEELKANLQALPLAHLANVPAEYEQEVLQKLLDQPTWNGLFNLDLLIRQYTTQIVKLHKPVQEGIFDTIVLDDKVIEQLGVQQF